MQCTFIKQDNRQCKAHSTTTSDFCFRHSPINTRKALEASKKGGSNRSPSIAFQENIRLTSTKDIQQLLAKTINGIWQGKVPIKVGSTIGFLTRCWLDAYEKAELEKRVLEIEKKLDAIS